MKKAWAVFSNRGELYLHTISRTRKDAIWSYVTGDGNCDLSYALTMKSWREHGSRKNKVVKIEIKATQ